MKLWLKPLVISANDIGRGQVMNYDDFAKVLVERVSKYYLARWVELFRDEVPNAMLLTNPLGLVISYVHEDQAFGN